MVVVEVATLAETQTVAGTILMLAVGGWLTSALCVVAVETHVFSVVRLVNVLTSCDAFVR